MVREEIVISSAYENIDGDSVSVKVKDKMVVLEGTRVCSIEEWYKLEAAINDCVDRYHKVKELLK